MRNRVVPGVLLAFILCPPIASAQQVTTIVGGQSAIAQVASPLSLELGPGFNLPLGDSGRWFSYGAGMDAGVQYRIPGSLFYLTGGLKYSYLSTPIAASVSLGAARLGAGIQIPLTTGISILGFASGGYYLGTFNDFSRSASDPYVAGGIGLRFLLGSNVSLKVQAQYENYLGLYQGFSAGAGVGISLGNLGGSVDIPRVHLRPAFPSLYKYYDDHPVGSLELKSNLKVPATRIRTQVYIKEFMDAPKVMEVPGSLDPGARRTIDLYSLFTDKVLNSTEGTKVAAEIAVSYTVDGQVYEDRKIETLVLEGRNAITWDDNRKAAAFVSAKDPAVLRFARSVTSYVQGRENRAICENLQAAMALHAALDIYGLNYSTNQRTPYSVVSGRKDVVDFVQFPRETFQYHAGDCSDISILYCALFQSVGIDTAFITIPGHLFIAFDSGLTPQNAPGQLVPEGRFIAYKGKAWVPLEVTSIHEGFLSAWELGAKEWTENSRLGLAGFYPLQEAWTVYQSVGLPGTEVTVEAPQSGKVLALYMAEIQEHIDFAIAPQVGALKAQIGANGSNSARNSLGVLYAKYGQLDKAEQQFRDAIAKKPEIAPILNLGHVCFARKDWNGALALYRQASRLSPRNASVLLALARVSLELRQYEDAAKNYAALKVQDPSLAGQFSYLGAGTESGIRRADVERERRTMTWETME